MGSPEAQRFEFGGFRLNGHRRTLVDARGEAVDISAKAFDTLLYFLEHPGQVIERSTLLEAVWPNVVVEENNLSQIVSVLRRVLGDGFIATVPRRGYQFVADVRIETNDDWIERDAAPAAAPLPAIAAPRGARSSAAAPRGGRHRNADTPHARRLPGPRPALVTAAVLALGVVAVAVTYLLTRQPDVPFAQSSVAPGAAPKVAVLPCDNLSPDPNDSYFAAGMHEEILNRLAQLSGLRVVARTSVMQYAENRPPIRQIAADLDAAAVMECSVRYAGTAVMVTAQLIDPVSDTHLWSQSYPGDMSDLSGVFRMQADIAIGIATALDAELVPAEEQRIAEPFTDSPEAYVELLKAFEQEQETETRLAHLDRAIEIDPAFAVAYVTRALTRLERIWNSALGSDLGGDVVNAPVDFIQQAGLANADAERALSLDPELGLAHFVLGATRLPFDKAEAEAEFERALALSPDHAGLLYLTAGFYLAELRIEEASQLIERIKQLAPNFFRMRTLLLLTRDYDALAELERRMVTSDGTNPVAYRRLALAEVLRGNTREALRQIRIAEELESESDLAPSGPGIYAYGRLGLTDQAKRLFDALVAESEAGDSVSDTEWIVANLGIGNVDQAYEWATRVAERPRPIWAADELWFVLNPLGDPALEKPRFLELRRRLGYGE